MIKRVFRTLGLVVTAAVVYWFAADGSLLTADQRAYRLYRAGDYEGAAGAFADPMWRGVTIFRQGEFEQAAGLFAGYDTPEAAFNQGNALVMQGKYEGAVARYERALELRPDWEPALINRDIAVARAAALAQEGGEGTGGKLGADEIVFSDKKAPDPSAQDEVEDAAPMSEADMRAVWLRQVQTRPADFLRAKFAYQFATREATAGGEQ